MRACILLFGLNMVVPIAGAHELEIKNPTGLAMHRLFHKVSTTYIHVDTQIFKNTLLNNTDIYTYYFDPESSTLFGCLGEKNSGMCFEPERAARINWTEAELSYGKQNGILPVDRHSHSSYFLSGLTPMRQSTSYVYYQGKNKVVRCRKTLTDYDFEFEKNGEHLFFFSDKKQEFVVRCERIYPK